MKSFYKYLGGMLFDFGLVVIFIMYVSPHPFVFWLFYVLRFVFLGLGFFNLWRALRFLKRVDV